MRMQHCIAAPRDLFAAPVSGADRLATLGHSLCGADEAADPS